MKNIKLLFAIIIGIASLNLCAQVAVTTDGSSADASAMLDVKSTTKGVLITRMTQSQRNNISSPATGLMIYQTDNSPGFYYYNGSWIELGADTDLSAYALKTDVLIKTNLTTYSPSNTYHPATKKYVDDNIPNLTNYPIISQVLTKTNSTSFTPSSNYHPATKLYVDGKASQWTTSGSNIYFTTGNVGIGSQAGTVDTKLLIKKAGKIGWNYGTSGNTCHAWISKDGTGPMIFDNSYGGTNSSYDHYMFKVGGISALTIQGDKNIGIGTDSPTAELEIAGNDADPPTLELQGNGYQRTVMGEVNFRNLGWGGSNNEVRSSIKGIVNYGSGYSGELAFFTSASNVAPTERMRINKDGKVGIGVSTYSSNLTYQMEVNGSVAGVGAYQNTSDKRFKKDIKPIDGALKKVLELQGVTFNWDKTVKAEMNFDDKNHIGFLAQDLEEVLPQVVFTAEDEMKTKSVAYGDVVPVLVEAIKEQQQQIEDLRAELESLKSSLGE